MQLKVWKWNHTWDDGHESYLYPSLEALMSGLHQYVQDQYNHDDLGEDITFTGNPEEDIGAYFDHVSEYEWYGIDSQMVNFPDLEPDQEVVLTSDECALAVCALDNMTYAQAGEELGIPVNEAVAIVRSAYNKLKD